MKKMFFSLMFLSVSTLSTYATVTQDDSIPKQINCQPPSDLKTIYYEKDNAILVEWEASISAPTHYLIKRDDGFFRIVISEHSISDNDKSIYEGCSYIFEQVPGGMHTISIAAVCLGNEDGLLVPITSKEVDIDVNSGIDKRAIVLSDTIRKSKE